MSHKPVRLLSTLAVAGAFTLASLCAHATAPRKTLTAFANEQELQQLFSGWAQEHKRRMEEQRQRRESNRAMADAPASAAPQAGMGYGALAQAPAAAKSTEAASADAVTNVQQAGVDEGGIVKLHGDYLVVLRRGRLFTVNVHDRELAPVDAVDAYGTGIDPGGAWYDEMLMHGNTIVVIGYSYARGGTEIGLFDLSRQGRLRYKGTYHLRSNDYYSSRNYASRLIGSKLVFYTPLMINPFVADPTGAFPAMRRWQPGATPADFRRIAPATRIYRTDASLDPYQGVALHTVSVCDLAKPGFDCESTAVMAQPGRVFYVSGGSVYVWTTSWRRGPAAQAPASGLFRIPLDGGAPSALKVAGSPIDQFSFLEGDDGHLNVLVRSHGRGDGMWGAETNAGDLALLRVALADFSDGRDAAPRENYRALPKPAGHALQNRYVGAHLLYGAGAGWHRAPRTLTSQAYAVRYASADLPQTVPLAHGVDRIEALGRDAVLVGSDGRDLHFTSVKLDAAPVATDRYTRRDAAQGETRSHGFFYRAENADGGLIGLPIVGTGQSAARQLRQNSAAVLYLRNQSLRLTELGALDADPDAARVRDNCRASCVDWYGNARPLFIRDRVFALMGYEIVEGRVNGTAIAEVRRVSFAPAAIAISR